MIPWIQSPIFTKATAHQRHLTTESTKKWPLIFNILCSLDFCFSFFDTTCGSTSVRKTLSYCTQYMGLKHTFFTRSANNNIYYLHFVKKTRVISSCRMAENSLFFPHVKKMCAAARYGQFSQYSP